MHDHCKDWYESMDFSTYTANLSKKVNDGAIGLCESLASIDYAFRAIQALEQVKDEKLTSIIPVHPGAEVGCEPVYHSPLRIYISTALSSLQVFDYVADQLEKEGFEITHDWAHDARTHDHSDEAYTATALEELNGVAECDVLVVMLPGGRGTHTELGAALALGKKVFVVSYSCGELSQLKLVTKMVAKKRTLRKKVMVEEKQHITAPTCVFYRHPNVTTIIGDGLKDSVRRLMPYLVALEAKAVTAYVESVS